MTTTSPHAVSRFHSRRWIAGCAAALALSAPITPRAEEAASSAAPVGVTEIEVKDLKERKPAAPPKASSPEGGYRASSATVGLLGDLPLQKTPLSLHVTQGEMIENRGAHTVSEALKANPAVATLMESSGYCSMSRVMIRGFTAADQSELRDGLVDRSFAFVPLENVERIEVLNGLSSFLYGFSAMGGTLNYVTKRPTPDFRASASAGQYGGGINYAQVDVSGPLASNRFGYRVIGYHEDGDTYLRFGQQRRSLIATAANWHLLPGTTLTGDFWFQQHHQSGLQTYFLPYNNTVISPALFDARKQYGQGWSYNDARKALAGAHLESALYPHLTLRAAFRYGRMWRDYEYVAATLTDNAGTYTEKAWATPRQTETTQSAYGLLEGNFDTGPVRHKATFGYTGTEYRYTRGVDVSTTLGSSTVASPAAYTNPGLAVGDTTTYQTQALDNLVFADRLSLGDRVDLQLGMNYAQVRQNAWGQSTGISMSSYLQRQWTPTIGLTVTPIPALSLYASYMEGLNAGGTAPTTAANANVQLPPSASDQEEIGAKATLGKLDLTAALFRINKINEYTDPSDNTYKQDGREVHKGVELTASGRLFDRLTVSGGFTYLSALVTDAKNNTSIEGKTPVNIPEAMARAYAEYDIPGAQGLTVTAGMNYSGNRAITATDTAYMDGAVTFDSGLRYQSAIEHTKLTLNANVTNLFDTSYWSYFRSGDGLLLGAPRLVMFSAKAEL